MTMPERTCAIVEARMRSTRLPGKVLIDVAGKPLLQHMIERVRRTSGVDDVVVATTEDASCDPIADLAQAIDTPVFRGSEDDVLARVLGAAESENVATIVELTGDCPLIDPLVIADVIVAYRSHATDYAGNIFDSGYPLGMETQVFSTNILRDVAEQTTDPGDREHVSLYIYRNPDRYRVHKVPARRNLIARDLRLTLDTPEDLAVISQVFKALYPDDPEFGLSEVIAFLRANPDIAGQNALIRQKHA